MMVQNQQQLMSARPSRLRLVLVLLVSLMVPMAAQPAPLQAQSAGPSMADFNGDGYADLAISVQGEDIGTARDAGGVHVLYGSRAGLSSSGDQLWHQDSAGIQGVAEDWDSFGWALSTGDFNGDGYADLAIGTPFEDVEAIMDAGAVNVLYGSSSGLSSTGNQLWHQDNLGTADGAGSSQLFGRALSAGDFNSDGYADLAIGTPFEDVGSTAEAGAVQVLYGTPSGLSSAGIETWHQDSFYVPGVAQGYDHFGWALSAGDFDANGASDLAIGAPGDNIGTVKNAGVVHVLYGTPSGLSSVDEQIWHQDSSGIDDTAEQDDAFGEKLRAGDFDGDGASDLAIGVPAEDIELLTDAGVVHVLYGRPGTVDFDTTGLSSSGAQLWREDSPGIDGLVEENDEFGRALGVGDFNIERVGGVDRSDLAIGAYRPYAASGGAGGGVQVLYGTSSGLSGVGSQRWNQDSPSILGAVEKYDDFGWALSTDDFDGNGASDLAIGVPSEDIGTTTDAGAVNVLYGSTSGLSSDGNQLWHQDSAGILGAVESGDSFGHSVNR